MTDTQNGVTATFSPGDDTASISISSLPSHKMYRAYQLDPQGNEGTEHGGDEDEGSGFSNGETFSTNGFGDEGEEGGEGPGGEEGEGENMETSYRWQGHSGTSLSYSVPFDGEAEGWDQGAEGYEGEGVSIYVEVWQPTVSVGGGGTTSEDSDYPVNFGISRDTPWGYVGSSNGDDPIPNTSVSLTAEGTATPGTDYKPALPTSVTLKQYVSPSSTTEFPNAKLVSFKAELDEEYDEPTETVNYIITANASEYDVASGFAQAQIVNAAAKYTISAESSMSLSARQTKNTVASVLLGDKIVKDKQIKVTSSKQLLLTVTASQAPNGSWLLTLEHKGNNSQIETADVTIELVDDPNVKATIKVTLGDSNG